MALLTATSVSARPYYQNNRRQPPVSYHQRPSRTKVTVNHSNLVPYVIAAAAGGILLTTIANHRTQVAYNNWSRNRPPASNNRCQTRPLYHGCRSSKPCNPVRF